MQFSQSSQLRAALDDFCDQRKPQSFRRGESIPMGEEDIWIVRKGVVQLSTLLESGTEIIFGLIGPDLCFGPSLTHAKPLDAKALSATILFRVHDLDLLSSPQLIQYRFDALKHHLQQTEALLVILHRPLVKDRLRDLILFLQQEFGRATPKGIKMTVKLTHQQLANMIGTTRVTVTRLMKEIRAEGLLI